MRYFLLILFSISIFGFINGQEAEKQEIVIGHLDKVYSDSLAQWRELYIHLPKSYKKETFKNKKYPVVYLLDGEMHFDYTAGMIEHLSAFNERTAIPEMIIVGIKNKNRWKDLTPEKDPFFKIETGGSEKFTQFLEDEVMPHVHEKYRTSGKNSIVGHSLGGLFVIHTMMNSPKLFDNYLAIDPCLWWLSNKYLTDYLARFDKTDLNDKKLYFAIANSLLSGTDTTTIRNDTTVDSYHMRSMLTFKDDFYKCSMNHLKVKSKFYEDETHGSLPLIATYDALKFFYDDRRKIQHKGK
ncbi:alpha/beta hydrolase [Labilibacter marinus]|uniref:alpha/beta hydrolase n=1 Tax=Labilibacter marinus TaxID=1477105 RepID=UPI0008312B3C|nr:alpha/beta hydrolase-fold protein [Labilibacter marinus]